MRVLDSSVPEEGEMFPKGGALQKMRTAELMEAQEVVSVLFHELSIDRVPCPALNWLGK